MLEIWSKLASLSSKPESDKEAAGVKNGSGGADK